MQIFSWAAPPHSVGWNAHFPSPFKSCEHVRRCLKGASQLNTVCLWYLLSTTLTAVFVFHFPDRIYQCAKIQVQSTILSFATSVKNSCRNFSRLKPGNIPAIFKTVSLSGCNQQFETSISVSSCMCQHQRESTCSCLQIRDTFHMCTLHSVLPNDYTLRYYAGKVATFCSICLHKREACFTPASWRRDIIPHNVVTTASLACDAACFKWQAGAAKWALPYLGCQAVWKPFTVGIISVVLCEWGSGTSQKTPCKTILPNRFQMRLQFICMEKYNLFLHSKFRELVCGK